MRFVPAAEMVRRAQEGGYAIPALNTNGATYDIARAVLEAAESMRSPVIIQVYEGNIGYRGFGHFVRLVDSLCDDLEVTVPVAVQLDHGKSFESVAQAIHAGFTSVMFDASHEPLETNIEETRRVVELAQATGVSVEAEVGYVSGNEPPAETLLGRYPPPERPSFSPGKTTVDEVVRFVEAVDVDMLAVSIGTIHGVYETQDDIDFERLAEIRGAASVPLVQHGTSGISLENAGRLARAGMAKINYGEPFRYDYIRHFVRLSDEMQHLWHPWRIMEEVKNRLRSDMEAIIETLGSRGRA